MTLSFSTRWLERVATEHEMNPKEGEGQVKQESIRDKNEDIEATSTCKTTIKMINLYYWPL
jgi:hypothetical protein